jgi:hypothetical protein
MQGHQDKDAKREGQLFKVHMMKPEYPPKQGKSLE